LSATEVRFQGAGTNILLHGLFLDT